MNKKIVVITGSPREKGKQLCNDGGFYQGGGGEGTHCDEI